MPVKIEPYHEDGASFVVDEETSNQLCSIDEAGMKIDNSEGGFKISLVELRGMVAYIERLGGKGDGTYDDR